MLDMLVVRFHLKGVFVLDGKEKKYCGGSEALSYIDRDKVSLPELFGHLRDHCNVLAGTLLHWLFPRKDLHTGLRALSNDQACKVMCDCIGELEVAEVYVEEPEIVDLCDGSHDDSDYEAEMEIEVDSEEEGCKMDVDGCKGKAVVEAVGSANKGKSVAEAVCTTYEGKKVAEAVGEDGGTESKGKQVAEVVGEAGGGASKGNADRMIVLYHSDSAPIASVPPSDSDSDSEYTPGDDAASDDDEEVAEIEKHYKEVTKKVKAGQLEDLDDFFLQGHRAEPRMQAGGEEDGNETPYADSDEEDLVEEVGSDGSSQLKPTSIQGTRRAQVSLDLS